MGLTFSTNGCITAIDGTRKSTAVDLIAGGNTASMKDCLDWAIDGFNVTGVIFIY